MKQLHLVYIFIPPKKIHAKVLKDYDGLSGLIFQNIMRNFLSALSTAKDEVTNRVNMLTERAKDLKT